MVQQTSGIPPLASLLSSFILALHGLWERQEGEQKIMLGFSFLCSSPGVVEGQRAIMKLTEELSDLNNSDFSQLSLPQRHLT